MRKLGLRDVNLPKLTIYMVFINFFYCPEGNFSFGEIVLPLSQTCGCGGGQSKCLCPLATEWTFVPERANCHALLPWLDSFMVGPVIQACLINGIS